MEVLAVEEDVVRPVLPQARIRAPGNAVDIKTPDIRAVNRTGDYFNGVSPQSLERLRNRASKPVREVAVRSSALNESWEEVVRERLAVVEGGGVVIDRDDTIKNSREEAQEKSAGHTLLWRRR